MILSYFSTYELETLCYFKGIDLFLTKLNPMELDPQYLDHNLTLQQLHTIQTCFCMQVRPWATVSIQTFNTLMR